MRGWVESGRSKGGDREESGMSHGGVREENRTGLIDTRYYLEQVLHRTVLI